MYNPGLRAITLIIALFFLLQAYTATSADPYEALRAQRLTAANKAHTAFKEDFSTAHAILEPIIIRHACIISQQSISSSVASVYKKINWQQINIPELARDFLIAFSEISHPLDQDYFISLLKFVEQNKSISHLCRATLFLSAACALLDSNSTNLYSTNLWDKPRPTKGDSLDDRWPVLKRIFPYGIVHQVQGIHKRLLSCQKIFKDPHDGVHVTLRIIHASHLLCTATDPNTPTGAMHFIGSTLSGLRHHRLYKNECAKSSAIAAVIQKIARSYLAQLHMEYTSQVQSVVNKCAKIERVDVISLGQGMLHYSENILDEYDRQYCQHLLDLSTQCDHDLLTLAKQSLSACHQVIESNLLSDTNASNFLKPVRLGLILSAVFSFMKLGAFSKWQTSTDQHAQDTPKKPNQTLDNLDETKAQLWALLRSFLTQENFCYIACLYQHYLNQHNDGDKKNILSTKTAQLLSAASTATNTPDVWRFNAITDSHLLA